MRSLVHFSRGLLLAGSLLAARPVAAAEEAPKKPADDFITANRKALESLRADPALTPSTDKLGLPAGLDMPGLNAGPAAPTPNANPNLKEGVPAPALKSSGWLIDGMEKAREESARDAAKNGRSGENDLRDRKDVGNSRTNSKDRLGATDDESKEGEAEREGNKPNEHESKAGEKVPNPLTGYMASWMTSGDFALLQKPAAVNGSAFLTPLPDFTNPAGAGLPGGAINAVTAGDAGGAIGFAQGSAAPPPNPYLQALGGNPAPAGSAGPELNSHPMLEPAPAPPPAWLTPPPPEPSRASPLLPGNLKPSDDAKYFPQLKRF